MFDATSNSGWVGAISRRVNEREAQRQILYNYVRKAVLLPVLLPEFLKMLLGSIIGFWVIARLLAYAGHINPLYTLAVFGLMYSTQATYYKYKLASNPGYRIPKCRCASSRDDSTERVLQSKESTVLRVPNSVLGAALYSALVVLVYLKHADTAMQTAIFAILVSVYLSYAMVVKIGSLCVNCINVAAVNVLILWQLLALH